MNIGTSYKQEQIAGTYDAIVIGSGIGGLAAAALLGKHAGLRVLVLERHYTAGGFTHTFRRPGFEWDVGVHYIGEVLNPDSPIRQLFDDVTNAELEWSDMGDVYDRIMIGDEIFDLVKGRERFRQQMHAYFPAERDGIDRYLAEVDATVRKLEMYFADKCLPKWLSSIIGGPMRWPVERKARRTTLETLRRFTQDPKLIAVLTGQYGDCGLPPARSSFLMHAMIANHYFEGGAYPVGGSSRFAATIVPVIESTGGAVFTNAQVDEILVENRAAVGVRLADGKVLRAPLIISDAGAYNTFQRMVPLAVRASSRLDSILRRQTDSMAHVCLYVGLNQTATELGLPKANLWVYHDVDHDRSVERFRTDPHAPFPAAYLSFASAKDPEFERRYPGRAALEVISVAPYEWFAQWAATPWKKRGEEYEALKQRFTERLLEPLCRYFPQVKGRIAHLELSTPLSTCHFTDHHEGAIYGLAATPERFLERRLRPQTPIRNLLLTGTDIASLGVAGALVGGLLTASTIMGKPLWVPVAKSAEAARRSKLQRDQLQSTEPQPVTTGSN